MKSLLTLFAVVQVAAFAPPSSWNNARVTRRTSPLPMVFDLDGKVVEKITTQDLLDRILDESLRTSARRPIMKQFDPSSKAIWRHWKGTVLSETWKSAMRHGIWAVLVYLLFKQSPGLQNACVGSDRIWSHILGITSFTITFFLNEAYSCWRKCLDIAYTVQGRLSDFSMAVAGAARRIDPKDPRDSSRYTPQSRKILLVIARYIRVFTLLSYAAITRSHRPLITPQGLRRMVARGLLTAKEREYLISSKISPTSRHNEVLMWCFRTALDAVKAGHLDGGYGFEQNLFQRIQEIRGQGNYMSVVLRARLPFAYAHIVQVLVDVLLWAYPVMAFSSGLSLPMGVVGSILLTTTYQGLFDLAKRFLDPFHNENFWKGDDPIMVSTIIAETNAGSMRWFYGLEDMPLSMAMIKSGDLDEFILPEEGYTVEEATAREEQEKEALQEPTDEEELVELEEAKAILNTPPAYEFVLGMNNTDMDVMSDMTDTEETDGDFMEPNKKLYDQFVEVAAEEFEAFENQQEETDAYV